MKVVIDTNILLSALISDSKTREIIVISDHQFYTPEAIIDETLKQEKLILQKSCLEKDELDELISTLLKYVHIIPDRNLQEHIPSAKEELIEVDEDDVVFLAAALTADGVIWSDDDHFKKQKLVPVYTTTEFIDLIE